MEKCKRCGHTLNDTDKFCPECGEKVSKRTVIYGPKAENIIVIDETDKREKVIKDSPIEIEIKNIKTSNYFVKLFRIIYQIIITVIAIFLLIAGVSSFALSAPIFGITCILMIVCLMENIHVFRVGRWKMFIFTFVAFFAIAYLGNSISINEGENLEQQAESYTQNTINNVGAEIKEESVKTLSKEEYIAQCDDYSYKDIARYPDESKGKKLISRAKLSKFLVIVEQ